VRLVALVIALSSVSLLACGGSSTAIPAPQTEETTTPSPLLTPIALGSIHTVEVPRDDQGFWSPIELIQGTSTFVAGYAFPPESPDNSQNILQERLRLAFFNPDAGELDEFRTLNQGDAAHGVANDGRYFVWEESIRTAPDGPGNLYALDIATKEMWQVAQEPGDAAFTVDNGRLVYFMLATDDEGAPLWDIHMVDLKTRTDSIISKLTDANDQLVQDPSLSGNKLVWVRTSMTNAAEGANPQRSLVLMDLSSGDMSVLVPDGVTRWTVIRDNSVLYAATDSMHLLDLETGTDQALASTTPWPQARGIAGHFAIWQNMQGMQAVLCDTTTGTVTMLSGPQDFVYDVYVTGQRVYWVWSRETSPSQADLTHIFLSSVDLPSE
jgi:hypothetical protein